MAEREERLSVWECGLWEGCERGEGDGLLRGVFCFCRGMVVLLGLFGTLSARNWVILDCLEWSGCLCGCIDYSSSDTNPINSHFCMKYNPAPPLPLKVSSLIIKQSVLLLL
jgi:hypothetical protein